MRLSNILVAYSEQKKTYTYYLEITFEKKKIINKTKFIVLKPKKKLKYYIQRLKQAEKLNSDYKYFCIGYV